MPIKGMINEMYSKDLSQKIQSCFRSKEVRGEIYTPVPFGYKKDQKNHLILDEEVSDVVMQIFLWKKSGMKEYEIAKKLSAQEIPTPFTDFPLQTRMWVLIRLRATAFRASADW